MKDLFICTKRRGKKIHKNRSWFSSVFLKRSPSTEQPSTGEKQDFHYSPGEISRAGARARNPSGGISASSCMPRQSSHDSCISFFLFLGCFFFFLFGDDIRSVHLHSLFCILTSGVLISAHAAVRRISQKRRKAEPTVMNFLSFPTGAIFSAVAGRKKA